MGRFSMGEIAIVLVIAVALFGYKKLPDIGKSLGRGIKNFKRSLNEPDEINVTPEGEDKNGEKKE